MKARYAWHLATSGKMMTQPVKRLSGPITFSCLHLHQGLLLLLVLSQWWEAHATHNPYKFLTHLIHSADLDFICTGKPFKTAQSNLFSTYPLSKLCCRSDCTQRWKGASMDNAIRLVKLFSLSLISQFDRGQTVASLVWCPLQCFSYSRTFTKAKGATLLNIPCCQSRHCHSGPSPTSSLLALFGVSRLGGESLGAGAWLVTGSSGTVLGSTGGTGAAGPMEVPEASVPGKVSVFAALGGAVGRGGARAAVVAGGGARAAVVAAGSFANATRFAPNAALRAVPWADSGFVSTAIFGCWVKLTAEWPERQSDVPSDIPETISCISSACRFNSRFLLSTSFSSWSSCLSSACKNSSRRAPWDKSTCSTRRATSCLDCCSFACFSSWICERSSCSRSFSSFSFFSFSSLSRRFRTLQSSSSSSSCILRMAPCSAFTAEMAWCSSSNGFRASRTEGEAGALGAFGALGAHGASLELPASSGSACSAVSARRSCSKIELWTCKRLMRSTKMSGSSILSRLAKSRSSFSCL